MRTTHFRTTALAGTSALLFATPALGQDYEYSWQHAYGSPAQFNMTGPATTGD